MSEKEKNPETTPEIDKSQKPESDDWYTQALEELEEFIESQGIYIRQ